VRVVATNTFAWTVVGLSLACQWWGARLVSRAPLLGNVEARARRPAPKTEILLIRRAASRIARGGRPLRCEGTACRPDGRIMICQRLIVWCSSCCSSNSAVSRHAALIAFEFVCDVLVCVFNYCSFSIVWVCCVCVCELLLHKMCVLHTAVHQRNQETIRTSVT
jgi:hypothetical protein